MSVRNSLKMLQEIASGSLNNQSLIKELHTDKLYPGKYQPRHIFPDKTQKKLVESIKEQGIIQPLIVRHLNEENEQFEIIAGERRWRAAKSIGLLKVPVVVKNVDDQTVALYSLIENIQRDALNPLEEAGGYKNLINEFNLSHAELAKKLGLPRSTISNYLVTDRKPAKPFIFNVSGRTGHMKIFKKQH